MFVICGLALYPSRIPLFILLRGAFSRACSLLSGCRPSGVLAPGHGTTGRCLPWCLATDSLQAADNFSTASEAPLAAGQSKWRRFCVAGGEIWILLSGESVAASKRIWRATIYRCRLSSGSSSQFGMIAESSTARAATVASSNCSDYVIVRRRYATGLAKKAGSCLPIPTSRNDDNGHIFFRSEFPF